MDANDEHPMLWLRNPIEGTGWKEAKKLVRCDDSKALKRRAHKKARKAAKDALRGDRPAEKARTGSGWDVA
jgi:hypothetical protein